MRKSVRLSVMAALGVGLLAAAPLSAYGQEDVGSKIIPSLEYQQADVREALEALFKDVGVSYTIAPEVQGQVTVSLHNVTFSTALQNVLRQVDATYRITAGIYEIVKREETPEGTAANEATTVKPNEVVRRIKVMSADPELIALLIGAKQGTQSWSLPPEISSLIKGASMGSGMGGMGGGMMGGGMMGGMGGMGGGMMGGMGGMGMMGGMGGMGGMGMGGGMGGFGGGMGGYGGGGYGGGYGGGGYGGGGYGGRG